eukprot:6013347-Pleurochrysis_carterae.AAC.1
MSYKWGHPVATLPVTIGTVRHTRRMTEILRIISQNHLIADDIPRGSVDPKRLRLHRTDRCTVLLPISGKNDPPIKYVIYLLEDIY